MTHLMVLKAKFADDVEAYSLMAEYYRILIENRPILEASKQRITINVMYWHLKRMLKEMLRIVADFRAKVGFLFLQKR